MGTQLAEHARGVCACVWCLCVCVCVGAHARARGARVRAAGRAGVVQLCARVRGAYVCVCRGGARSRSRASARGLMHQLAWQAQESCRPELCKRRKAVDQSCVNAGIL